MGGPRSRVTGTGEAATLPLPSPVPSVWKEGTEVVVTPLLPEAALLLRAQSAREDGVLLASVATFPLDELFGLLVSGMRTGKLVFTREKVRKVVHLRDGQVIFAASTEPWERLGTALCELGLLDRKALAGALSQVKPGTRLGQVVHRMGLVSQAQLYGAMAFVAREIVVNLLAESHGHVLFVDGAPPPEDVLRLPDPTRALVLEGVKRADDVRRLGGRYPRSTQVVRTGASRPEGQWGHLWDAASEPVSLAVLRARFEGSEYAFHSAVDGLLAQGALTRRAVSAEAPSQGVKAPSLSPALERYVALVGDICRALSQAGHGPGELRGFLEEPLPGMEDVLAGVTLGDDGVLHPGPLAELLAGRDARARAAGYEALHGFLSYALFTARNVLPPEVSERLQKAFRHVQEGTVP